jgi:hypothetical protein
MQNQNCPRDDHSRIMQNKIVQGTTIPEIMQNKIVQGTTIPEIMQNKIVQGTTIPEIMQHIKLSKGRPFQKLCKIFPNIPVPPNFSSMELFIHACLHDLFTYSLLWYFY